MKRPGDRIERYVIHAVLGKGGMGEVYQAVDERLGRTVALKLLAPDADDNATQRMLREARAAAALEHPNAVVVFDVGSFEGTTYLAMELVRGRTLRRAIRDAGAPLGRRLRWLVDVARALGAAHRAGLVHRDVKPDNVMIRDDGVVKVLDFGIARRAHLPSGSSDDGETLTTEGVVVGTPHYAAPEQLRAETVDGRADQFSWGVMAYEVLSGARPWTGGGDTLALLSQILSSPTPSLRERAPDVPEEIALAIHRALQKDAGARFPSIDEAADVLEEHAEHTTLKRTAPSRPPGGSDPEEQPTLLHPTNEAPPGDAELTTRAPVTTGRRWSSRRSSRWALGAIAGATLAGAGVAVYVSRTAAPGGPLVVDAVGCEQATVEGTADMPVELADAVGIGACARLAVELGVPWRRGEAALLRTRLVMREASADVTLSLGALETKASRPTPLDAVAVAVAELAKVTAPPPMTAAEVAGWGAADADAARRIRTLWLRVELAVTRDRDAEVAAGVRAHPDSPWPHVLAAMQAFAGTDARATACEKGLAHAHRLPAARADAVRGLLLHYQSTSTANRDDSLRLLRKAYAADPDDPDVLSLYATATASMGLKDESDALLQRLVERHPTRATRALRSAITLPGDRDVDRERRWGDRLRNVLPESAAWYAPIRTLALERRFDEARFALRLGNRLGMGAQPFDRAATIDGTSAWIELADMQPAAARGLAAFLLADTRDSVSSDAATTTIASYAMEGRLIEAQSAGLRELERQRALDKSLLAAWYGYEDLRLRRWMTWPAAPAERIDWLERTFADSSQVPAFRRVRFLAELTLARALADPKAGKQLAERGLKSLEGSADRIAAGDGLESQTILVGTLPLVRYVHGDRAAAELWKLCARAPIARRRHVAFDAGLALEASGAAAAAERAYELAADPIEIEWAGFPAVAAHVRLAALLRARGKNDDAARIDTVVTRVWAGADSGLLEAVRGMR